MRSSLPFLPPLALVATLATTAFASDGTWASFSASASNFGPCVPTYGRAVAYDARRHHMLLFGGEAPAWHCGPGCNAPPEDFGITLACGEDGGLESLLVSTRPRIRAFAGLACDSVVDRLWLFGGRRENTFWDGMTDWTYSALNDLWSCDLSQATTRWDSIVTAGDVPPPRSHPLFVLDTIRHRLVLAGGQDSLGNVFHDAWTLALDGPPAWAPLATTGVAPTQPSRDKYSPYPAAFAVFDSRSDRMQVLIADTLWSLSFSDPPRWTHTALGGALPSTGAPTGMDFDARRDRLLVLIEEGQLGSVLLVDPPRASTLDMQPPLGVTSYAGLAYDAVHDGLIAGFFDSSSGPSICIASVTWAYASFPAMTLGVAPAATGVTLGTPENPARSTVLRIPFALPRDDEAALELFDVAGRRLEGCRARGGGAQAWDVPTARLRPGLLLVRLRSGDETLVRRFVYAP